MDWAEHGVKILHSDELDLNTPQTSGMTRLPQLPMRGPERASCGPAPWWFNRMSGLDHIIMANWRPCFTW
jgi:hypothetical protein